MISKQREDVLRIGGAFDRGIRFVGELGQQFALEAAEAFHATVVHRCEPATREGMAVGLHHREPR